MPDISQLLQALMGGSQATGMSVSGAQSVDPSGSTPQPAPLSGLALASDISGIGAGAGSMSGSGGGSLSGGQTPGPDLNYFTDMLKQMQGSGELGAPGGPNLGSLFGSVGQDGVGGQSFSQEQLAQLFGGAGGSQFGAGSQYGQAGGLTGGERAFGGGPDAVALIQQALGLGQKGVGAVGALGSAFGGENGGLTAGAPTAPAGGDVLGSVEPGSLVSSYFDDPGFRDLFTSGMLTESMFQPDVWDSFSQDPAFLNALTTGEIEGGLGNLDTSGWAGDLSLDSDFSSSGVGSGAPGGGLGLGTVASGLGGLQSLFGLYNNARSGNILGAAKDLYGTYGAINSLFDLGGPTFSNLLSGLGGAGGAAGGLGAATMGLGAAEAGIGLGAGEALGGGGAALAGAGGIAGALGGAALGAIPAMAVANLAQWLMAPDRSTGFWNNPIRGQLSSASTAGTLQTNNMLDFVNSVGSQNLSPEFLQQQLGTMMNGLLPYYATAQGGVGAVKASDTFTGANGGTPYTGDGMSTGKYTEDFTRAQSGVTQLVQQLLDRGMTYEQLGQTKMGGNWASQMLDVNNPLQSFYNQYTGAGGNDVLARLYGDARRTDITDAGGSPTGRAVYQYSDAPMGAFNDGQYGLQDIFNAAQGGDLFGEPMVAGGGNINQMYGGALWNAMARMGVGGPGMQQMIQQNFDPYRGVQGVPGADLLNSISTYAPTYRPDLF